MGQERLSLNGEMRYTRYLTCRSACGLPVGVS